MFRNRKKLEKWLRFQPLGDPIPGTPFVAFKVPIHKAVERLPVNATFSFEDVFALYRNIKLVIDLNMSSNFYDADVVSNFGALHFKLPCRGHGILPNNFQMRQFNVKVNGFLRRHRNELIGVHCTHGVNRTGYMICQYMIREMGMSAREAIGRFQYARRHPMERQSYISDLYRVERDVNRRRAQTAYPVHRYVGQRS